MREGDVSLGKNSDPYLAWDVLGDGARCGFGRESGRAGRGSERAAGGGMGVLYEAEDSSARTQLIYSNLDPQ